jgi:DNA transformation protein
MPVSSQYLEYILDQLGCVGSVVHKRMFGGIGLYFDDLFFGLIDDDVLYFKVDDQTRTKYEAARAKAFQPYGEGSYSVSYYAVPASVLEDQDQLRLWCNEAVGVARRKGPKKSGTKKRKSR